MDGRNKFWFLVYKNSVDIEFLVQMRQSNKCGSVRNDEIFNILLINSE